MLTLIIFLIVGAGIAYIAQFNLLPVSFGFGQFIINDIPLFFVIIGAFLAGLILAYVIFLINSLFITFKLRNKDSKLKHSKLTVLELTRRVHQLELENEKLKQESPLHAVDDSVL